MLEHIDILRALACKQERHFGRRSLAQENSFGTQCLPSPRLILLERFDGLCSFVGQFCGVPIIDGQSKFRAQIRFRRRHRSGRFSGQRLLVRLLQASQELGFRLRTHNQGAAQRRFEFYSGAGTPSLFRNRNADLGFAGYSAGNIFFQYEMKVRTAEAESADRCAAHAALGYLPRLQLRVHIKRRTRKIDIVVGPVEIKTGRNLLFLQSKHCLQDPCSAGGAFEMPDVGLHGTKCDGARGEPEIFEYFGQAFKFRDISDRR